MVSSLKRFGKAFIRRLGYDIRKIPSPNIEQAEVNMSKPYGDWENIDPIAHNSVDAMSSFFSDSGYIEEYYLNSDRVEFYHSILLYIPDDIEVHKVLDAGSGPAYMLKLVAQQYAHNGLELHAADFAESLRSYIVQQIPGSVFKVCSLEATGYETDLFDLIFCNQVLEHLLNPRAILHELHRVCKPNGVIIITVPDGRTDTFRGHINFWSPESWKAFIQHESEQLDFIMHHVGTTAIGTGSAHNGNNIAVLRKRGAGIIT